MGQHKVAKAIKEKHVIKFQKFDSPKSQKLTLIINGLRSLPRPYGMVLISFEFLWPQYPVSQKSSIDPFFLSYSLSQPRIFAALMSDIRTVDSFACYAKQYQSAKPKREYTQRVSEAIF